MQRVEFFSELKLAHVCLKAIEIICYLHSQNVYYGDMKPANLLIFRDYKIKIGDLGMSMKLPDDCNMNSEFYIKGYTPNFIMPELENKVEDK